MSSFLTSNDVNWLTSDYQRSFDTFSLDRTRKIVVFKTPLQSLPNININEYVGYGNENNIQFTVVSGEYPAIIKPNKKQQTELIDDANIRVYKGEILIKVEENAKNFIDEGKNEKFLVDGMYYNTIADKAIENFFGLKFYIYGLERTS